MKKVMILHAWYSKPHDHWYLWLKKELEKKGSLVYLPELPTMSTGLPDMQKQLDFIAGILAINSQTTVIGHSLGCLLALRIAEKKQLERMILVAGWDFDDLTKEHRLFWPNKINHDHIKANVKQVYCFSSDNDPYFTAYQAEEMSKRLGGKFILIKKAGHFTKKDNVNKLPLLLDLFK